MEGKLSYQQERNVTLIYLCGVKLDYILEHYGLLHADQRQLANITSREWNDPLVEFYRQTNPGHRLINSGHLFLAFHDREVPQRGLVDLRREGGVYKAVMDDIYAPLITRVIDDTRLESFNKPNNGLERLITDIFGARTAESVVEPILADNLQEEYQKSYKFSMDGAYTGVRNVLISIIKYGGMGIAPRSKKAELIYEALAKLPQDEYMAILLRYGLADERTRRLAEVALIGGVTRERINIRVRSALKKLRNPSIAGKLKILTMPITDLEFDRYISRLQLE